MRIMIDIPNEMYDWLDNCFLDEDDAKKLWQIVKNGTPYTSETVTEFADRCKECGKVNKKKVYRNCRDAFVEAVKKVFTDTDAFLDFIENVDYSNNYDCFETGTDECYIINRNTGEYINWYKFTHIGRDIHSTVNPDKFEEFLQKFYDSSLQN